MKFLSFNPKNLISILSHYQRTQGFLTSLKIVVMKIRFLLIASLVIAFTTRAQSAFNYTVALEGIDVPGLPGLHSFAFAQHEGKWLIIGGRTDGLHARQPFNSFPEKGNNTIIYVVDITKKITYSASIASLPDGLRDQLQSGNMNFYQDGNTLYLVGGYAYSPGEKKHITYPFLTAVDVVSLTDAVQQGKPMNNCFSQIRDDLFAVAGGQLGKIGNVFYLVGGHRFDGRYNPMGHPSYRQQYTHAVRRFSVQKTSKGISFTALESWQDEQHLRRRDFNLLPMIMPDDQPGYLLSSGVFQENQDLPFLYPVIITGKGYQPIIGFNQYLSNYHSAKISLYDKSTRQNHLLFFGGMSQHYLENGERVRDDLVPFVSTISVLTYYPDGSLKEIALPVSMPGFMGSSAEFILNRSVTHLSSEIIRLDALKGNRVLLGHIAGGIQSQTPNPFSRNQTNTTRAVATVYAVYLLRRQ